MWPVRSDVELAAFRPLVAHMPHESFAVLTAGATLTDVQVIVPVEGVHVLTE